MRSVVHLGRALVVAGGLAASVAAPPAARAAEVRVAWEASRVSLQAQDAPLVDVLRALGARAGFVVEGRPDPAARVTLSLDRVELEQALRQVLRGVSHALVYDAPGTGRGPAAVVLTGASGRDATAALTASPPVERRLVPLADDGLRAAAAAMAVGAEDTGEPPVSVREMLAARALAGAPPQAAGPAWGAAPVAGGPPGAGVTGASGPAASPTSPETIAELTRRARSQLNALVQGLSTAAGSLAGTLPAPAAAPPTP